MCRLALMNREAIALLGTDLANLFHFLETSMGGHGNGIAALWSQTKEVKMSKGLTFSTAQAAAKAHTYVREGADWLLFHTSLATSGGKTSANCHPCKSGQLVLAHNGHSWTWDQLGTSLGISDSECITQAWARLRIPVSALKEADGVFVGFRAGSPFVVKGRAFDDLTVSAHEGTGAVLFASELEGPARRHFNQTVEIGRFLWSGGPLNILKIEQRRDDFLYYRYTRATSQAMSLSGLETVTTSTTASLASDKDEETPAERKVASEISLADLREFYQRQEQEATSASTQVPSSVSEE